MNRDMKRTVKQEEEIKKQAKRWFDLPQAQAIFWKGAEWADEHPKETPMILKSGTLVAISLLVGAFLGGAFVWCALVSAGLIK